MNMLQRFFLGGLIAVQSFAEMEYIVFLNFSRRYLEGTHVSCSRSFILTACCYDHRHHRHSTHGTELDTLTENGGRAQRVDVPLFYREVPALYHGGMLLPVALDKRLDSTTSVTFQTPLFSTFHTDCTTLRVGSPWKPFYSPIHLSAWVILVSMCCYLGCDVVQPNGYGPV